MTLRPYQVEACEAIEARLDAHRSTLAVLPTGTGKTVLFAEIAHRRQRVGRTLVIAHRGELLTQACEKIDRFTPLSTGIEMADQRVSTAALPDVVVASVQTLANPRRRERFDPDAFALVVVDEAHHAPAASYRAILDYFRSAKVLGVTATPDRLDSAAMGSVFDSVAYVYEIRTAITDGFLVPIRQRAVQIGGLDLSQVRNGIDGDLDPGQLEAQLLEERALLEVAQPTIALGGDRRTIVFCAGVEQAKRLAEVLNHYEPGSTAAIDGDLDPRERAARIARFQAGELRRLTNCAVLTEGFDSPEIACVVVARPTKSRALYAQMIGRGTRLAPGKADLLVLDFRGNAGRHRLVCALDVLEGNLGEATRERAELLLGSGEFDVLGAIEQADQQLAEEARARELAARRAAARARVRYTSREIDPFAVLGASSRGGRFGGAPATARQIEVLARAGIETPGLDRGQASALIDQVIARRQRGLCTYKMALTLARHGLNPDVGFGVAREALDAIAAAGWRAPDWLLSDPRFAGAEVA